MAEEGDSSEDRNLEPTERRLERAREQGQFPQSRDLSTLALIAVFMLLLFSTGPMVVDRMVVIVQHALRFSNPARFGDYFVEWSSTSLLSLAAAVGMVLLPIWIAAIVSPLSLVGFRPRFALRFNGGVLNPLNGIGRMLSTQTLAELIKSIVKAGLVLGIGISYLLTLLGTVRMLADQDFKTAILNSSHLVMDGAMLMLAPLVVIAAADVGWQWYKFRQQVMMSREEMKQEMKESEGSPEIRQRIRQRQREMARSRMMAAVERADVVLANPEHYAVALRYDQATMAAPVVVAKGQDALALRIREIASDFQVPVARIPALARMMYAQVEIGEAIPIQLFEAVARVLAWAYETKEGTRGVPDLPDIGVLPDLGLGANAMN